MMLLLDAVFINNGGGKVLLDYLITCLEKSNIEITYLLDERILNKHPPIVGNEVYYLKAGLFNRHLFYKKHGEKYKKVFCFGNQPPTIRLSAQVYTYFQQVIFLNIPQEFSLKEKMKFLAKSFVLKYFKNNTDYWFVQSGILKGRLVSKFHLDSNNVKVLPFYPPLENINKVARRKLTYLYVSGASAHKNHVRLIEAFCEFYKRHKVGILILTVPKHFAQVWELINQKKSEGYPIENLGFVRRDELATFYQSSEFVIFPSLTESFGLGLVEAIENDCKIIGADLPYTYAVCKPSITFDPLDINSILLALENSLSNNIRATEQILHNKIGELLEILKE